MSGYLLDTNCISELVSPNPNPRVISWFSTTDESLLYLSVLTLGEIRKGIAGLTVGKRRTLLESWIEGDLLFRFSGRIVPVDAAIADRWGLLAAQAKSKGRTLPVIDGLLAASALHLNLTLVSRNASDFAGTPIQVMNPWSA